jgi:hypothetical protein
VSRIVKLDLHTHPVEALKLKYGIKGIGDIKKEVAADIVASIKASGIDGIAITERNNFNHGWAAALEIMDHFRRENIIILPGAEIEYAGQHLLRLYIPEYYRRRLPFFKGKDWFLILAHPGYYNTVDIQNFYGVTLDAVEEKSGHGYFSSAQSIALTGDIPAIVTSDAHKLEDIGSYYTEMEYK